LGQKVHPIGFRLGVTKDWQAKWYADKHYTELLQEDLSIRQAIESKYAGGDISRIEIERSANHVTVTVHTARPGIVIGRGGQRVDEVRLLLEELTKKRIRLNIQEIRQPELDAFLVARNIAQQLERRISYRRAMKQAISRTMESGAQGIKVTCSGRLTGSEYSRRETLHRGRVPLHTLRADIDYAIAEAHTVLGCTGVKVWIYKGDILPKPKLPPEVLPEVAAEEAEEAVVATAEVEEAEEAVVAAAAEAKEAEEAVVAAAEVEVTEEEVAAAEAKEAEEATAATAEAKEAEEAVAAAEVEVTEEEVATAEVEVTEEEVAAAEVEVTEEEVATAEAEEAEEAVVAAAEVEVSEEEVAAAAEAKEVEEAVATTEAEETEEGSQ
jgi:small subunit ribosomal protein S3